MLCSALLSLSSSNAQDISTTGNLIDNRGWTNIRYTDTNGVSPCCSGGPGPAMNQDTNTIRFSYGMSTTSQIIGINKALENAGVNVKITGYNYSWLYQNDGLTSGTLNASVGLGGTNGSMLEVYNYSLGPTNGDFKLFEGKQSFNTPYDLNTANWLGIAFTGKDSRFWAGYYGPRVRDVSLSLDYSASTTPPTPDPKPVTPSVPSSGQTNVVIPSSMGKAVAAGANSDPTSSPLTNVNVGGVELSTTGTISAPDGLPQTLKDAVAMIPQGAPQNDKPTQGPESSMAPSGGSAERPDKAESKPGAPMSLIMSAISKIQENDRATQKAAVQNATQQISLSVSKSQEQAASIVSSLNTMSAASSQASIQSTTNTQSSQSSQALNLPGIQPTQISSQSNVQTSQVTSFSLPQVKMPSQSYSTASVNSGSIYNLNVPTFVQTQQQTYTPQNTNLQVEISTTFNSSTNSRNNTLTELMESKTPLDSLRVETQTETVNKNVQSNELAGGVDIAMMALQPKGYESYSFAMKDVSFYEPKEIYNKQKNVDNIKVLRQLSSDRLHQEMIDQQYKGK